MVVPSDSQAKRDGYDLAFVACRRECANALRAMLQQELDPLRGVGPD